MMDLRRILELRGKYSELSDSKSCKFQAKLMPTEKQRNRIKLVSSQSNILNWDDCLIITLFRIYTNWPQWHSQVTGVRLLPETAWEKDADWLKGLPASLLRGGLLNCFPQQWFSTEQVCVCVCVTSCDCLSLAFDHCFICAPSDFTFTHSSQTPADQQTQTTAIFSVSWREEIGLLRSVNINLNLSQLCVCCETHTRFKYLRVGLFHSDKKQNKDTIKCPPHRETKQEGCETESS